MSKKHKNFLAFYACLLLENIISGFFSEIDIFFLATRLTILLVGIAAVEINFSHVLFWLSIVLLAFSASSMRSLWTNLESEKLAKHIQLEETKIEKPEKPTLPDCKLVPKYERQACNKDNAILQVNYSNALNAYNEKVSESEKNIKTFSTDLTFYESQPVLIYAFLLCVVTGMTIASTTKPKEKITKTEKAESEKLLVLTKEEKVKLIESRNRTEKISQKVLCEQYGISLSDFKRSRAKFEPKTEPFNNLGLEGSEENRV